MAKSEIRATLTLDCSQFNSAISQAQSKVGNLSSSSISKFTAVGTTLSNVGNNIQNVGGRISQVGQSMQTAGKNIIGAFAPVAGVFAGAIKTGIDFEDAFAGVKKTVDETTLGAGKSYDTLRQACINLSKEMPQSASDIASVMEIAGQLGIKGADNLEAFTKTAVQMGDSTNMSANDAATGMARFLNITGSGSGTVGKLGSTIVNLGNNLATTESEILNMGLRIAGTGKQVGMTDAQMMGWAGTMSSLGIEAEAGGTAFSSFESKLEKACANGGDKLAGFAKVAGMSASEFKQKFETDASGATEAFIKGLANIEQNGGSVSQVLSDLGINETRQQDILKRLTGAVVENADGHTLLSDAMKYANEGYSNGTALADEAAKKYETFGNKLKIFKNRIQDVGIAIYDSMKPYLEQLLEVGNKVLTWVEGLNPKFLGLVGVIATVGVAFGGILIVVGKFVSLIGSVVYSVGGVIGKIGELATGIGNLGGIMGLLTNPITLVIAGIAAFAAAMVYCWNNVDGFKENVMNAFNRIKEVVGTAVSTVWDIISTIWGAISPFVTEVFQGCAEIIGEVFLIILDVVVPVVENIWNTIQTVWGAIKPYVETIFGGISTFLSGIWQTIYSVIKGALDIIKAVMDGDWGAIKDIVINMCKGIWEGLQQIWDGIVQMLKGLWDGLVSIATTVWNAIKDAIASVCDAVMSVIQPIWDGIVNFLTGLWNSIVSIATTIWTAISNAIQTVCQAIWSVIEPIWNGIKAVISTVCDVISQIVSTAWMIIQNVIENVCTIVGGIVMSAWENIKSVTSTVFEAVKSVISTVWNAIKSVITTVVNAVKPVVTNAWNAIKSTTSSVFNAVKSVITTVWNAIKSAVTTVVNAIKSVVTSVWNGIKSTISSVMNGIKGTVSSIWNNIKSTVSSVVNGIKSTISNAFNSIKSTATSVWNGIKSAIINPIKSAQSTLTGIISRIKSAFSNMHISIPKPKLPHINVSTGTFLGVSYPKFSVSWYAKGGFFNKASMIGVGEAGKEAVLPLENKRNMKPYAQAVASLMDDMNANGNGGNCTINITQYNTINNDLDIKKVSQELAKQSERELRRKGLAPKYSR